MVVATSADRAAAGEPPEEHDMTTAAASEFTGIDPADLLLPPTEPIDISALVAQQLSADQPR
jgi:hypothetical protein